MSQRIRSKPTAENACGSARSRSWSRLLPRRPAELSRVFEESDPIDTPLHVHESEDELFYVLEGEHVFQVGDAEFRAAPAGLCSRRAGSRMPSAGSCRGLGAILVLTSPAGFEGFFRELAAADRAGALGPEAYASASEKFGITWLN